MRYITVITGYVLTTIVVISLARCAHAPIKTYGVPDLVQVRPLDERGSAVWRSGQPPDDAWPLLREMGITDVVKLNYADEGSDVYASSAGITVHHVPIPPSTLFDGVNAAAQSVFDSPDKESLLQIYQLIAKIRDDRTHHGWLVHCQNGHDRTGLVIGWIRLVVDSWDPQRAWKEMVDRGYHPELVGLDEAWIDISRNRLLQ